MLHAFIDETGDRGTGAKSSKYFAMAALVMPEHKLHNLKEAITEIKTAFKVPPNVAIHWVKHCRPFERRQFVASVLSKVVDLRVNYVVFEKAAIPGKATIHEDGVKFYNYVAGIALERVLLTCLDWTGPDKDVRVFFEHVRGFNHEETSEYFFKKRNEASSFVNWNNLAQPPKFVSPSTSSGLQAADLYAGILRAAILQDEYGGYQEQHFLKIRPQIRQYKGAMWGAGFKVMASDGFRDALPWWPKGAN